MDLYVESKKCSGDHKTVILAKHQDFILPCYSFIFVITIVPLKQKKKTSKSALHVTLSHTAEHDHVTFKMKMVVAR
jgi:hypothetical protein